jgi:hypothetical protein
MTNGERLELSQPWQFDASGKRVLFRGTDGVLKAVRANEVDLEASRMGAFTEPRHQTKTKAHVAPQAALVLQDGDVAAFDRTTIAEADSGGTPMAGPGGTTSNAADQAGASKSGTKDPLEIVSYSDISDPDTEQIVIYGTLRNNGTRTANRVSVMVSLMDERGQPLASSPARLVRTDISAGRTSNFQVTFVTPTPYASVEFDLGHK